jgi:hypothetical protein
MAYTLTRLSPLAAQAVRALSLRLMVGAALVWLGTGCGFAPLEPGARCLKLTPSAEGLWAQLPSRVSVLFSVDTCAGEPVPNLGPAAFTVKEDGVASSAFESGTRLAAHSEDFAMASLLLLDISGSILESGAFPQLLSAARGYARAVLQSPNARVAVMGFDGRAQALLVQGFTGELAQVERALDGLAAPECSTQADCAGRSEARTCAAFRCVDASTNLNGAVVGALGALEAQAQAQAARFQDTALVVFTDGRDLADRVSAAELVLRVRTSRAHLFTVGLGREADAESLERLGRDGFFPVDAPQALAQAFDAIAARVNALANRFYALDYCSPRRGGRHTLEVEATVDTPEGPLRGSLSGAFDATGFQSGCAVGP